VRPREDDDRGTGDRAALVVPSVAFPEALAAPRGQGTEG